MADEPKKRKTRDDAQALFTDALGGKNDPGTDTYYIEEVCRNTREYIFGSYDSWNLAQPGSLDKIRHGLMIYANTWTDDYCPNEFTKEISELYKNMIRMTIHLITSYLLDKEA